MPELTLHDQIIVDFVAVTCCILIAGLTARSLLHPAWMLLGVHFYTVTIRLLQLAAGYSPLQSTFSWPVDISEITRTALTSDFALLAMGAAWITARHRARPVQKRTSEKLKQSTRLRMTLIAIVTLVVGLASMIFNRHDAEGLNTSWDTSGYVVAAQSWPGFSLCVLHFVYGFPPLLTAVTAITLAFTLIFNSRFAFIIPIIFLILLWLSRRKRRGLPVFLIPAATLIVVIWLPMKPFVRELKRGSSLAQAYNVGIQTTLDDFSSEAGHIDSQFLDMIAATMSLQDIHGQFYWGGTIFPLLVSPVPRIIWPDKPWLNQYQWDLDIPARSLAANGMTAGLVGEAYVNLGYLGVLITSFAVSLVYSSAYTKLASIKSRHSPHLLLYLIFLSSIMQVYRDGLISAVWFPYVYAAPIAWIASIEIVLRRVLQKRTNSEKSVLIIGMSTNPQNGTNSTAEDKTTLLRPLPL